jgi:hypothetical protein
MGRRPVRPLRERWNAGHRFELKADGAQTGGTFSLIEFELDRVLTPRTGD